MVSALIASTFNLGGLSGVGTMSISTSIALSPPCLTYSKVVTDLFDSMVPRVADSLHTVHITLCANARPYPVLSWWLYERGRRAGRPCVARGGQEGLSHPREWRCT